MAVETYTDTGYGIVNDAALDDKYIILIKKLSQEVPEDCKEVFTSHYDRRSYIAKLDSLTEEFGNVEDVIDDFYDCPLQFLSDYLNYKYNSLGFYAPERDEDSNYGLLYTPLYPWEGKDGDKKLTKETVDKEFTAIADALGWNVRPETQVLYYCG